MCGIAGCVGHNEAVNFVVDAIGQLDERGYDSSGVAYPISGSSTLEAIKAVGPVENLRAKIPVDAALAATAIGHTRWATHGKPGYLPNAHPQLNGDSSIAIVHNGIIENHAELRAELEAMGYEFRSGTDTEVVPHLLQHHLEQGMEPDEAFDRTVRRLEGAYAILASLGLEPDTIYAARRGSPLHMGVKGNQRFVASMRSEVLKQTRWADSLQHFEMARLSSDPSKYKTWHFDGKITTREPKWDGTEIETFSKGEYRHWMLKEIHDAPETLRNAMRGRLLVSEGRIRLGGIEDSEDSEIRERFYDADRIVIVGCGTAYYAGSIGARLFEDLAGIPAEVHLASEYQYEDRPINRRSVVIGVSQSGETADTLRCLTKLKPKHLTLGVNNSPGSEMETITHGGVHCNAGREKSVASTKAFMSQVTVLAEMALAISKDKESSLRQSMFEELAIMPDKIEQFLEVAEDRVRPIAEKYAQYDHCYVLGRGYESVTAEEGALKIKEITGVHAEGYPAGEMKHGPIRLIGKDFPTIAIATDSTVQEKVLSNIQEVLARDGPVIALVTEGQRDRLPQEVVDVIEVPKTLEQLQPLLNVLVFQLFTYYLALARGLDKEIDRPPNLAKSVTVE
ncbi:MAG TPA: glutamine--fructose-6-phosphate transaminase (isomerizing) [Candidatus Saccharimonadales bacterium]|nr:glutamine--fructose-6-phosphate transaminase (isomerizing) [Candidatus Saccharimonadales bacterium]